MRKLLGGNIDAALGLTTIDLPAIVSVTDRAASLFAAIVQLKVPEPVPVVVAMEIHVGTPDAAHVQADVVAIETLLVVPLADAETLAGVTVNPQVPRCVTVLVPVAGVADVIVSQLAFATAFHWQVVPAVTVTEPVDAPEPSAAALVDQSARCQRLSASREEPTSLGENQRPGGCARKCRLQAERLQRQRMSIVGRSPRMASAERTQRHRNVIDWGRAFPEELDLRGEPGGIELAVESA